MLEFRLADERYAVETRCVREVYPLKDLTPLPGMPPFFRGLVNVRGRILPVVDLKKFFDLPDQGLTDLHCIQAIRGRSTTSTRDGNITGESSIILLPVRERQVGWLMRNRI